MNTKVISLRNLRRIDILVLVCLATISLSINKVDRDLCEKCQYLGGLEKVVFDIKTKNYKKANMELGESGYSMEFTKCKFYKSSDIIKISGIVWSPHFKEGYIGLPPAPGVQLLLGRQKNDMITIEDDLAITDENGEFTIEIKYEEDKVIFLRQSEKEGSIFQLKDFMKK